MKYEDSMFNIYITIDNEEYITLTKMSDELSRETKELDDKYKFFKNEIMGARRLGYYYIEIYILKLIMKNLKKDNEIFKQISSIL